MIAWVIYNFSWKSKKISIICQYYLDQFICLIRTWYHKQTPFLSNFKIEIENILKLRYFLIFIIIDFFFFTFFLFAWGWRNTIIILNYYITFIMNIYTIYSLIYLYTRIATLYIYTNNCLCALMFQHYIFKENQVFFNI